MLSSKCAASLVHPDPAENVEVIFSYSAGCSSSDTKTEYFSSYRANNGEIHRGLFACVWLLSAVIFILLWLKRVPMVNGWGLLPIPTFRCRTSRLASTGVILKIPLSCSSPGSMLPLFSTFFFFLSSLPWWMLPRPLPLQCGWCQLLQISGQWYLLSLGVPEEAERYILTEKNPLPPLPAWAPLALSPSQPLLHSWRGTIINMPLSLLPWPDREEKGLGLERKMD